MAVVLITGCRRPTGFGQLSAISFAKAGHTVYATMRSAEEGKALVDRAKGQELDIRVLGHDVTSPESNRNVVSRVLEEEGRIDVMVSNAGIGAFGAVETMREETLRAVMETNFFGGVDLARAVLPAMREQGKGRVIFVTSVAGRFGVPSEGAYSASKFALEGLAEVLSYEVKRFGVDVSIVEPGFCNTGMSAENTSTAEQNDQSDIYDAFNKFMIEATIQGELAGEDPQCVADMILEAATTAEPKLRWQPGEIGSAIMESWSQSTEEEWHASIVEGMQLGWWVEGKTTG